MSNIESLRARLAEEEAENRRLRGLLSELGAGVASAYREMSDYEDRMQNTLRDSNNRIYTSHDNIIRAYEMQAEIDRLYVRFKNMELANKKIRAGNNKKYYDFANYNTVRKIVGGILDNLNLNLISDAVIYKSIEKQHLKAPDYWLTAVLIGIMAWKNDDRDLAERAVALSVGLDEKNSAVFFMLFNIRMGREEAALKWFRLYQTCELTGRDASTFLMLFSLLNKTLENDVNDRIKYEVLDFINRVISLNAQSAGYDEGRIVDRIERYIQSMKGADELDTLLLKRCLTDYADMADIVVSAENNMHLLQFILDVSHVTEMEKNTLIDRFINEEVGKPNQMEQDVYDEIEYNELVIACGGDMELAEALYEDRRERRAKELDLITEMADAIYAGGSDETVSPQVRKNMFALTEELQRKAAKQYVGHYRQRRKDIHPAQLGDYTTQLDFNDREGEGRKIQVFYETERDEALRRLKLIPAIVGAAIGGGGAVLALYLRNPLCLIISGIGAALIAFNILSNNRQKKHIEETCQLNINNKNVLMDRLFEEYRTYKQKFSEYDACYDRIVEAFDEF